MLSEQRASDLWWWKRELGLNAEQHAEAYRLLEDQPKLHPADAARLVKCSSQRGIMSETEDTVMGGA